MQKYADYTPAQAAWLDELPSHWQCTKIGALFSERKSKVSDKDYAPLSVARIGVVPQLATAVKTDAGDTVLIKHSNSPTGTRCIPASHKAEFSRPYAAVASPAGSDLNPDVFKTFHFDSVLITLRISLISPPERSLVVDPSSMRVISDFATLRTTDSFAL